MNRRCRPLDSGPLDSDSGAVVAAPVPVVVACGCRQPSNGSIFSNQSAIFVNGRGGTMGMNDDVDRKEFKNRFGWDAHK